MFFYIADHILRWVINCPRGCRGCVGWPARSSGNSAFFRAPARCWAGVQHIMWVHPASTTIHMASISVALEIGEANIG